MSQTFRKLLENDNLLVGISELSRMCEISPRQLRYWEQKGLIQSVPQEENAPRKYRLPTVIKVELIKRFLDEGFTLTKAVEKAEEKIRIAHHIRKVFTGVLQNLEVVDDRFTIISLGPINESNQILHIIHDDVSNQLNYELLPENQPLTIDKYQQQ
ncbi:MULTISPECIES: MerR family transcriptional regulator [Enterococcus]|uniref:MerR family transcriptional regulator n=1 Tax=Enterococcus TaxID=1350 RepID=UPI0010FF6933|nr:MULTISPECIES: MerR family transcriptional regulator [Enterococcus]MCR1928691.1 MerR family transcriptional regulator [Enterococcus gallinarum]QCT92528.1 MerR family transcriptional regulator [Enterococcus sp. M190262]GMG59948.1 MerR family transcriptional regulator [Enterococcus gallinarum]